MYPEIHTKNICINIQCALFDDELFKTEKNLITHYFIALTYYQVMINNLEKLDTKDALDILIPFITFYMY